MTVVLLMETTGVVVPVATEIGAVPLTDVTPLIAGGNWLDWANAKNERQSRKASFFTSFSFSYLLYLIVSFPVTPELPATMYNPCGKTRHVESVVACHSQPPVSAPPPTIHATGVGWPSWSVIV